MVLAASEAQNKTAQDAPAPFVKAWRIRCGSALAYQGLVVHRRLTEIPAHAQHEVVRRDVLERRWIDDVVGPVEGPEVAGQAVTHVEITVRKLDGEVRADVVSNTRMQRPG